MAYEGEAPPLRMEDLVSITDHARVRRGKFPIPEIIRSDDSEAEDSRNPKSLVWKRRILDDLASGSSKKITAAALEALQKVDRAREVSRSLKCPVIHDFRVGAKIARQACLVLCQRVSRFGAD